MNVRQIVHHELQKQFGKTRTTQRSSNNPIGLPQFDLKIKCHAGYGPFIDEEFILSEPYAPLHTGDWLEFIVDDNISGLVLSDDEHLYSAP